jgi:hypothetical protein
VAKEVVMKLTDRRRYDMLARVREFGVNYGHLLPESTRARQALATIDEAVAEVQALDEIGTSALVIAARKAMARRALLDLLTKVDQTARVLAAANPALKSQFALSEGVSDRRLLIVARQFARDAAPHAAEFAAHGMPTTFVADLEQRTAAFDAALRERGARREERVAARARIAALMAAALAAVRTLDVIVTNHLASDPVTRAVWQRDSRVVYPRRPRKTTAAATPAPTSTVAEPPAPERLKAESPDTAQPAPEAAEPIEPAA